MGCISSKKLMPYTQQVEHDTSPPPPLASPSSTTLLQSHTIDAPSPQNKGTMEPCRSFHTVEEYDALLQRISNTDTIITQGDGDLIPNTTIDSAANRTKIKEEEEERGIKRKKVGEGLAGSLQIGNNNNVQFQTVGSLRQWLDVHVYSPDGAATPKFGTYTTHDSVTVEVDPELVAAFDQHMQLLQVEEDNILKQIGAN